MLNWSIPLSELSAKGIEDRTRRATDEEVKAIAAAADLLACKSLVATYSVKPLSGDRFRLAGRVEGEVEQACVVTLAPVAGTVADEFDVEFRSADDLPASPPREEAVLEGKDIEPLAAEGLPLGRIVYETFVAAIDPYPRVPGAGLPLAGSEPAERKESPFAVLKQLKSKS